MENILDSKNEILTFNELQQQGTTFFSRLWDTFTAYIPTLIIAAVLFIIGMILNKIIISLIRKGFNRSRLDATVYKFLTSLIKFLMVTLVIIIVLSVLGIPTTSIITVIGSAGLAIGLSMKDSLSSVVGGILILFEKHFKVGDYVDINGTSGNVEEITLLCTRLKTPDNKVIYLPNGTVSSATIVNYSQMLTRRVDWTFTVGYTNDFRKAIEVIKDVADNYSKIKKEPEPFIHVSSLGLGTIDIVVRVWVDSADYWDVYYDIIELIKEAFDNNDITIPNKTALF